MSSSSSSGILFPLASGEQGHLTCTDDGAALIRSSIGQILCTRPRERVNRPSFGVDLRGVLFSPNDEVSAALAAARVRDALARFEQRIVVVGVSCTIVDDRSLAVAVDYRLRSTGRSDRYEGQTGR